LEFSFDRSRNSNNNSAQNTQQGATQASATDEVDTSTISNERLRKAIERNRARQRQRDLETKSASGTDSSNTSAHQSAWEQHNASRGVKSREEVVDHVQSDMFEKSKSEEVVETRVHVRAQEREHVRVDPVEEIPVAPTRKSVARPHDTEFAPVKRTTKRAAAQISYTTGNRKKAKELNPKITDYLVKGSWLFCGFLILRLIFASGGVVSYFSQKSILNDRFKELSRIKKENMGLVHEIERMQLDAGYQKKLVRDNLGFIAQDEFLVLFPKD
jgi:cell division protein FtsB